MPKIIDRIPTKKPRVERLAGNVSYDGERVQVGRIELPEHLTGKFLRRCEGYDTLQDAVDDKEMHLRGKKEQKPGQGPTYWFGLVSEQFRPIPVQAIGKALGRVSSNCTVRYLPLDRFQLHYGIPGNRGELSLFLDSGEFGLYGGNGESAMKCGVSLLQNGNFTLFQYGGDSQRVIHRITHPELNQLVGELREFAQEVPHRVEESKDTYLDKHQVAAYLTQEVQRYAGSVPTRALLSLIGENISAFELASLVNREAQHLESKRLNLERLAGDILFSPEKVVQYGQ